MTLRGHMVPISYKMSSRIDAMAEAMSEDYEGQGGPMQLKASIDYGLRAVLFLAAQETTCSSKDIAESMSIPRDYLIQLAQLLRRGGIIEARPGKHGGYRLAGDPSEITLLEVMDALEEDGKGPGRPSQDQAELTEAAKRVREAYQLVSGGYDSFMGSITLEMMLQCTRDSAHANEILAQCLIEEGERLKDEAKGAESN